MELADYIEKECIYQNGLFDDLGYSNSKGKNLLTFCDNVNYLHSATISHNKKIWIDII